jgi:hypothetical protein
MNRVRRGADLFVDKADYQQFIDLLIETADLFNDNVAAFCRYPTITIKAVRRGIENEPRDVAIYLIRSMRSDPLMRVGAGFGMNRYSSVSSAVMRVKTKLQKDRKFKKRLAHLESNILKSQTKTPILMLIIRLKPTYKKSSCRQSGELCSNWT